MRAPGWLAIFAFLVMLGSVLPWVDTPFGSLPGYQGGGLWTLSAGAIMLAGTLLHGVWPRRGLLVGHALVGAGVALALAGWQAVRLVRLCGGGACGPGVGLVLVGLGSIGGLLLVGRLLTDAGPQGAGGADATPA